MDRNFPGTNIILSTTVALRKESVDRNITTTTICIASKRVALRKESVDRNLSFLNSIKRLAVALRKESVDRNSTALASSRAFIVALRKESVDRNITTTTICIASKSRSPQGERG